MRLATLGDLRTQDLPCTNPGTDNARRLANSVADSVVNIYLWSQIEPACAVICACLPVYRPLFVGLNAKFFSGLSLGLNRSKGKQDASWTIGSGGSKVTNNANLDETTGKETVGYITMSNQKFPTKTTRAIDVGATVSETMAHKGISKDLTVRTDKVYSQPCWISRYRNTEAD